MLVKSALFLALSSGLIAVVGCDSNGSNPNAMNNNRAGMTDATVNQTGTPGNAVNGAPGANTNNAQPGAAGNNQPAMSGTPGINSGGGSAGGGANTGNGAGNTGATGAGAGR
jgi:hypothetical protein